MRVAVTLVLALVAGQVVWRLWEIYMLAPWTRDARVQALVVKVAPDVSGWISSINVVDNQKVAKGDILFVIDQKRFEIALAEAQANLAHEKWNAKLASDNARRDESILKADSAAISAVTVETSQTRAGGSSAIVALAEARLASAELDMKRSVVRAPVDGYVANLVASAGDYATAGQSVLAVIDSNSFYLYAYFMETKIPRIAVGDPAEIRMMSGGEILHGRVQGLSRAIADPTAAQGRLLAAVDPNFEWIRLAQRIPVHISIEDAPAGYDLAAGMSATVVVRSSRDQRERESGSCPTPASGWLASQACQWIAPLRPLLPAALN